MKIFDWLKSQNKREKLKAKYCYLMRRAYEIAPRNKQKSDALNKRARNILQELKKIEFNQELRHSH
ncbi:Lacal_2735 family protein [Mesonia maritima]|uniref:Uncharacterized protein (DUF2132 family) n=1 Tax=Mesonia maritima TaxID=1793873 RepID=A0ABU1K5L8_9FLAO|nr:Lacal_2735 family protein [Mesonia maritima]MDR6300591.1 uncharacterized protein (DUF2132 family) [Mesonia maritima]